MCPSRERSSDALGTSRGRQLQRSGMHVRPRVASSTDDVSGAPGGAKRRRVQSANAHNDFMTALHDFSQWSLAARERSEQAAGSEQTAALCELNQLWQEAEARQSDVEEVRRLAARLCRGFQQRGERDDVLRKVERVEADYQDLRRLVSERRDRTEYLLDEAAFYEELGQLGSLVDQHLAWVEGVRPRPAARMAVLAACKVSVFPGPPPAPACAGWLQASAQQSATGSPRSHHATQRFTSAMTAGSALFGLVDCLHSSHNILKWLVCLR